MSPAPLLSVRNVVAVASGKGGVGKTTVTVNLAMALAETGLRVGIFDADIYGPNVPLLLGITRQESATAYLPIVRAAAEPYIDPIERFGLKVMSFGLVMGERDAVLSDPPLIGRLVLQTMRDVKWGDLDVLLLDLPPGSGEPHHTLLQQLRIDGAVVVTTPQDLSLLDAGRSLDLFRRSHIPILGIVENMSTLICPHCGEPVDVFHRTPRPWAVQSEALEVLGEVPLNLEMSRGVRAGPRPAPFPQIAARLAAKLSA